MSLGKTLSSVLRHIPVKQRRQLKAIYERMPGFGRKSHYADYGEDAFLQSYFQKKYVLNCSDEMMLPAHLQKNVGQGFYVDVGAHAPKVFSSTYWFYRRGWHGINIDAAPGTANIFHRERPRDINSEMLISDRETELTFYYWDTPFGVNTVTAEHARYMARMKGREPHTITMTSRRLDNVLAELLPAGQEISFMTIDVEGHDLSVLRSNDWERFRPELVLVEDFQMFVEVESTEASNIYRFMRGVDYEMYAWLRPTVVYRQAGLTDWLVPANDTHEGFNL